MSAGEILKMLWRGPTKPVTLPAGISFTDQSILITGATSGLGLEAAIHFVKLGAKAVHITGRSLARGETAKEQIETRARRKDVVVVHQLDMDTLKGVKSFADKFTAEVKTIDVVILNAGVSVFSRHESPDGWEESLQVNVLSTTLLALLLLPWMKAVQVPGRLQHLTVVGSGTHTTVNITANNFPKENVLQYWNAKETFPTVNPRVYYSVSKLFLQYNILEIAKLVAKTGGEGNPIVNPMCPGGVRTNLGREFTSKSAMHKGIANLVMSRSAHTGEEGSKAVVDAATRPRSEHGKFILPYMTDAEYNRFAAKNITNDAGKAMQATIWKETVDVLGAAVPGVSNLVYTPRKAGL